MPTVDLIWLGQHTEPQSWGLGQVRRTETEPAAVQAFILNNLPSSRADAWLFWGSHLPAPDSSIVLNCLHSSADVWHAGLRMGTAGMPGLLDFVAPTETLYCDPAPDIEASSWRLSLNACLIRSDMLRTLAGLMPGFETLTMAGLEMGHRALMSGAIMRHIPNLLPPPSTLDEQSLLVSGKANQGFADEALFMLLRFGSRWQGWALVRAVLSGYMSLGEALAVRRVSANSLSLSQTNPPPVAVPPAEPLPVENDAEIQGDVAVIIPTLGRNTYLRTLLNQIRAQTVKPREVIVIDQNPPDQRDEALFSQAADLPLTRLLQSVPGQCTARNRAIQHTHAEYLLLIDDDDEITPDLIAQHLAVMADPAVDASCGRTLEVDVDTSSAAAAYRQISPIFPANNTMIRREALAHSGLFDTAYDHAMRADSDLGMRLYLSGALMIYDPAIAVLHHHAPIGGLRAHRQRVVTYASSRQRLTHRNLPSVSEIYYTMRYFTPRQLREMLWLRVFGTFAVRGGRLKQAMKMLISLSLLPDTLIRVVGRYRMAQRWIKRGPQIPLLDAMSSRAPLLH
jgi:glycosyltransferase involved in cell wall biosynthesis